MTINIPLSVSEYAGIQRVDEPLTSGVPLPESANIISALDLEVCDNNNIRVPAQFTVLSRWHGIPSDETKPIKWVLLDFNADVNIGGTSTYYLRDGAVDSTPTTDLTLKIKARSLLIPVQPHLQLTRTISICLIMCLLRVKTLYHNQTKAGSF